MGPVAEKPITSLILHRIDKVEKEQGELEKRVRALEIAHARIVAWTAGAAFAGGLAWQLAVWLMR